MTRRLAQADLSRAMFARDSSESPTIRMVRDGISREEAYDVPRDLLRPTRLAWRGTFTRLSRQDTRPQREPSEDRGPSPRRAQPFVAPPWRFADWSFAVLAGIAGLLTALAVFVLIGVRGGQHDTVQGTALRTLHTQPANAPASPEAGQAMDSEEGTDAPVARPDEAPATADTGDRPTSETQAEAQSERPRVAEESERARFSEEREREQANSEHRRLRREARRRARHD